MEKYSVYNYTLPKISISEDIDENLLELLGGNKYKNHCKILMFIKAYNNRNKKFGILQNDGRPRSFFTQQQVADYFGIDRRSVVNIINYLVDNGFISVLKNKHECKFNHVNFYLYSVDCVVEEKKNIHLDDIVIGPAQPIKIDIDESKIYIPDEGKFEGEKISTNEARTFYERIRCDGTKLEVSDTKNIFPVSVKQWFWDICAHQCDTYFVGGVNTKLKTRCGDNDIAMKKYFAMDIDIRSTIKKHTGEVISDNQLYGYIDEILKILDESDYADYDEVVMSGNGVHIYYIGTPRYIDKEIYKTAVSRIFNDVDILLSPLGLKTDKAVSNISSLFRCPATVNYGRMSKYGLDFGRAFVYKRQEGGGNTYDNLESIAAQVLSEKEQAIYEKKLLQSEMVKVMPKKDGNVFEIINSIPVDSIFSAYTGLSLQSDGRNFKSNKDGKNIGCFYNKDKNIIVNTGTHYLVSDERSYSTFDFVLKEVLGLSNTKDGIKETIQYFKDNYSI